MLTCSPAALAKRLLLAAMAALSSLAFAGATDISDVPMAVKNNVPPNFMYMIDNSGSMLNIVPGPPYSAAITYNCPRRRWMPGDFPDPKAPSDTVYDIFIQDTGALTFTLRNGSDRYKYGTSGSSYNCFNPGAYYNFRLLGDATSNSSQVCGSGKAPCKHPSSIYNGTIYSGNFLNWYFSTSSPAIDYARGRRTGFQTRMEIATSSVDAILDSLPLKPSGGTAKLRVGLSTYNNGNGGSLLKEVADLDSTQLSDLKTSIDGLEADGATPLAETLADIGHYFSIGYTGNLTLHPDASPTTVATVAKVFKQNWTLGHQLSGVTDDTPAPIQYWCQRSYAILMTDGLPSDDDALSSNSYLCDYDGSSGSCNNSGYLKDVAQALYEIDLRPNLPVPQGRTKKNNIRTYTVGFADDQVKSNPLLGEAAAQGGGTYSTAGNASELIAAFNSAMNDAFAKDAASSAIAVVNTQITTDNTSYASNYNSGFWSGDLSAYTLDTTTGLPSSTPTWSAAAKLDALPSPATSRNIVTFDGSAGTAFRPDNVTLANSDNTNLVNYLRGDKSHEDGISFRKRKSILGDIINAEPVVVKYGDDTPIVFQGANDGMLHVFCGALNGKCANNTVSAGQEMWAYVPKMVWPNLTNTGGGYADPNYAHQYFVDATPATGLVGSTRYLVGGLGKGGQGYYALNITSYTAANEGAYASKALWEFPASSPTAADSTGYSYGTPLIVNTPSGWRVLVASGYNNANGSGKLFALDPATGAVLETITTPVGSADAPAGLAYIAKYNFAGANDVIKYVYGGDLLGNVWRFDLTSWTAVKIAELSDGAGNPQPVSSAPVVGKVSGSSTKYFVYIGTGLYLGNSDVPGTDSPSSFATQVESMYGIIDDTTSASPALPDIRGTNGSACPTGGGDGDFLCQDQGAAHDRSYTGTDNAMTSAHRGWYFDIPIENGRVTGQPQLTAGGALVFTINAPTNTTCDPGGSSSFANVNAANGGAIATTADKTSYYASIIPLGYALASRAVIISTSNDTRAVVRMSDQTFGNPIVHEPPPTTPTSTGWRRVYWRELM